MSYRVLLSPKPCPRISSYLHEFWTDFNETWTPYQLHQETPPTRPTARISPRIGRLQQRKFTLWWILPNTRSRCPLPWISFLNEPIDPKLGSNVNNIVVDKYIDARFALVSIWLTFGHVPGELKRSVYESALLLTHFSYIWLLQPHSTDRSCQLLVETSLQLQTAINQHKLLTHVQLSVTDCRSASRVVCRSMSNRLTRDAWFAPWFVR